jgi:hypothetical protein
MKVMRGFHGQASLGDIAGYGEERDDATSEGDQHHL